MTNSNDESERHDPNRREFLRNVGLFGAAAIAGPSVLAACGSSSKSTTNTTAGGTATTGGGTATTAGGTATTGAPAGDVGSRLATLLGVDPATAAKGEEFQLASVLALTGGGAFYGKTMGNGINLAVKHIAAAGGPNIKVSYWDHKSGDPVAGVQAITEIVAKGFQAKLASYVDDLGAMLKDTAAHKIFTIDGGGGTATFGKGVPFFWGARAITPNDQFAGVFRWFKDKYPGKTKVGCVIWDLGADNNNAFLKDFRAQVAANGMTDNGLAEFTAPNATDYSAVLPKITANQPDLLFIGMYGQDIGSFFNQSQTAGITSTMVAYEYTIDGITASKGSFEKGFVFSTDYYDTSNRVSPLSVLFIDEFKKAYGTEPDFYAANFYEDTLIMWELIRRIKKSGGTKFDGPALEAAMESNLTCVSLYGGDANTVGTMTFDATTHSLDHRPCGIFEYKAGKLTTLATWDIGGKDYKLIS